MYPKWVEKASRLICEDCHGIGSFHDIIAIGIARPNPQETYTGSLAMMIVACPVCGERMSITIKQPMESVMEAMAEFAQLTDQAAKNAKPPIQIPPKKPVEPKVGHKGTNPLRPSIRENQPGTPPTQREIQSFLQRLRKTSFKSGSKGFKDWMKGFGVNADDGTDEGSG